MDEPRSTCFHTSEIFRAMAEPDVFDPYEILGVSGGATLEE